jgi:sialate O-acetylesterase
MPKFNPFLLALLLLGAGLACVRADVRMPALFGDHMVLQQGATLPVWGRASPGEKVTVSFGTDSAATVAGSDGKWRVDLAALPYSSKGGVLTVTGKNKLSFQDVLIGDVWVASGQSNMEYGINKKDYAAAVDKATDPLLRLFFVPRTTALTPQADLLLADPATPFAGAVTEPNPKPPPDPYAGKWLLCTPEALRKINGQGFATVAYYFARAIRAQTGQPLGMIQSAWGGTRAEAWTSLPGLEKNPPFTNYLKIRQKNVDNFASLEPTYLERKTAHDAALKAWYEGDGKAFNAADHAWKVAVKQALAAGQPEPPEPKPATPRPGDVHTPDGGPDGPANLYNAMIAPLMPFAIKGVIWYQGEFNSGYASGREYATLFPRMIESWRDAWGRGNFPFIFVQLPNFGAPDTQPSVEEGGWRWVRDAQFKALALPNTAMAITIDVGDPQLLHPPDKLDVGLRVALAARRLAYGENIVASGPLYDSMTVEGSKIRVKFRDAGTGLTPGVSPYHPDGKVPVLSTELRGFGIAGADHTFVPAQAVIDGDSVVVSSDKVSSPIAVRYDFSNSPTGNLYNKEGLPASPFRTDDWDDRDK